MYKPILDIASIKKLIFEKIDQETIFKEYGIEPKKGVMGNPFRLDNKPTSCSFYKYRGTLYFKDFTGWCKWDCFDLVAYVNKLSYNEAVIYVYKNLINYSATFTNVIPETTKAFIEVGLRNYTESDIQYWLSYGITEPTLSMYNVHAVEWARVNGDVVYTYSKRYPCYAYYLGKTEGVDDIKLYFPKNKRRFLGNTSKIQGLNQLTDSNLLIIQKSMKDVMLMRELGFNSISFQAEGNKPSIALIEELKARYKEILVWYDSDETGIEMSKWFKLTYNLDYIEFNLAKDPTDYVLENGIENFKQLDLIKWLFQKNY